MQLVNILKKYRVFIFTVVIFVFILFLLALLTQIDSGKLISNQNTQIKSGLKGYESLIQAFEELDKDSSIPKNARYQKLKNEVISLENPKLSKKEKYDNLASAEVNLFNAYLLTKNDKLYAFNRKIADFAKTNFSEYYKEKDFRLLVCYDPTCADYPQPKEILNIVQEINSSNLPDEVKKKDTEILNIYTFATKDQASARVENYYFLAQMIKKNREYEKVGLNIKISNEIMDYLKKNYPDLLFEISGIKY